MKIRNGFVSNSSTSSFVLIGFYVDADKYPDGMREITKLLDCGYRGINPDIHVYDADYYGCENDGEEKPVPDGKFLIGVEISDIEHEGNSVLTIKSLTQRTNKIRDKLGLCDADLVLFHHLTSQ